MFSTNPGPTTSKSWANRPPPLLRPGDCSDNDRPRVGKINKRRKNRMRVYICNILNLTIRLKTITSRLFLPGPRGGSAGGGATVLRGKSFTVCWPRARRRSKGGYTYIR